jgi:5-methyltetrahydropteroyltriglutamate--homocysteine methyltransferase
MQALYRAEVVGSLLRPSYLTGAREAHARGELSAAQFKQIEDRAVDQAIALQEGAGVDVVTDGEMRRQVFFDQLIQGIEGLGEAPAAPVRFHGDQPGQDVEFQAPVCVTGKVRRRRMLTPEEFVYARARARRPVKVTLPSPLLLFALWSPAHSREAYPDPFELFADGAEIVRDEARELVELGCEYIQIDAPELCQVLGDPAQREIWSSLGIAPERVFSEGVDLINAAADVAGATVGLHMCRGNYQSRWIAQGGYEEVSEQVFPRATNYDVFLLEYDDPRSGSFEPLRKLPDDKTAVLGLISSKRDRLEEPEQITRRIEEATRYAPREQLALSTQCGFASDVSGNLISEATQGAKLRLVADVAHEAWG